MARSRIDRPSSRSSRRRPVRRRPPMRRRTSHAERRGRGGGRGRRTTVEPTPTVADRRRRPRTTPSRAATRPTATPAAERRRRRDGRLATERRPDRRLRRPARCGVPGGRRPAARGVGGGARRGRPTRRPTPPATPRCSSTTRPLERGETISLADASSATRIEPRLRERRIAVKRAAGRKRLRWAFVVVVVAALVVAALAVLGSSLFAIDEVHVDGAVYTDPAALQAVVDDLEGTPVLRADTDRGRARAGGDPVGRRRPRHDAVPATPPPSSCASAKPSPPTRARTSASA